MKVVVLDDFRFEFMKSLGEHSQVDLSVMAHPVVVPQFVEAGFATCVRPLWPSAKIDLRTARQLRRELRDIRPDIVQAFTGRGLACAILATGLLRDPPKLAAWWGIASVPSQWDPANYLSYLHPRVVGYSCESNAAKRALIQAGVAEQKCVTTYNCVPRREVTRAGRAGLAPWKIPENAFVVGTVVTFRRVKGIDILLRAAQLCADLTEVHWVIIGERRKRERELDQLAADERIRDRVHMIGFRADAQSLMSGFDLFAMPSRSEGLCRALLEAMTQGICPVVTDAGGMKEAVRHERDGLVVPSENPQALADAIRQLVENRALREQLAASAAERISDKFLPRHVIERQVALYERMLGRESVGEVRPLRRAA
jgi:glycosyltransferase involved in cell wall biosynthesis